MTTKLRLPYLDYMKIPKSHTTRHNQSPIGEAESLGKQFSKAKKSRQHSEATLRNLENRVLILQSQSHKLAQRIQGQHTLLQNGQQKRTEMLNETQQRRQKQLEYQEQMMKKQQQTYQEYLKEREYKRKLQEHLKDRRHEVFMKMKDDQIQNERNVQLKKEETIAVNAIKSNKVKKERLYGQMRIIEHKSSKYDIFLGNYQSKIRDEQSLKMEHDRSIRHLEILEQSLMDEIKQSQQMSMTLEEQMTLNNSMSTLLHPSGRRRQQTISSNTSHMVINNECNLQLVVNSEEDH